MFIRKNNRILIYIVLFVFYTIIMGYSIIKIDNGCYSAGVIALWYFFGFLLFPRIKRMITKDNLKKETEKIPREKPLSEYKVKEIDLIIAISEDRRWTILGSPKKLGGDVSDITERAFKDSRNNLIEDRSPGVYMSKYQIRKVDGKWGCGLVVVDPILPIVSDPIINQDMKNEFSGSFFAYNKKPGTVGVITDK